MLNKVILIGRLTKDPEIRVTTSGVSVGTFSLAVNRNFASANGEKETDFFNCVCFRKVAEIVSRYVKKGQLISVDGRIQNRTYDAQDGTKRYVTEIVCDNVVFLESSRSQNDNTGNYQQQQQQQDNHHLILINNLDLATITVKITTIHNQKTVILMIIRM